MGMVLPTAAITTSASMMVGIDRKASLTRLNAESRTTPPTAAAMPRVIPTR